MMNQKVDPLNEERSVIDNLIASSQNLMGSTENPVTQPCHNSPSDYQMTASKSKMMMKSRRGRTSFTPSQLSDLESAFSNTHYPDFQTRKDLSNRLKIPDDRIQVWFQNRRAKWRKTQRQLSNGAALMTCYRGNQTVVSTANSAPQSHEKLPPSEITLSYNMARPSPIRHTASLVKSETPGFSGGRQPVSQSSTSNESKAQQQHIYQAQEHLGNLVNIYEKLTTPHTSEELGIPENQRTAPSLYSLSATVTSTGQYIILGPGTNLPTTYPPTMNHSNYPVHVPSTSTTQKF